MTEIQILQKKLTDFDLSYNERKTYLIEKRMRSLMLDLEVELLDLKKKLKDKMAEFQVLRENIQQEYRDVVDRRVYTVTGERADEDTIDELIETGNSEQIFQKAIQEQGRGQVMDTLAEIQERHDAVRDLEKKLLDLQQIFLDMAVLVDAQGEMLDNRFRDLLSDYSSTIKDCEVVIIRLGVTTYKIAMVLTALRSDDRNLICSDIDFESAIDLVEKVYLQHSLSLFNHLVDHGYTETEKTLLRYMPYGVEIKRSEIFLVPPPDTRWSKESPPPKYEEVVSNLPDFNATHFSFYIKIESVKPGQPHHSVAMQEYRTEDKPISFTYDGGKNPSSFFMNIRLLKQLEEQIKETLIKAGEPTPKELFPLTSEVQSD